MLFDNNAVIGGLHMVHEREDQKVCGPVMPQGKNKLITGLLLPIKDQCRLSTELNEGSLPPEFMINTYSPHHLEKLDIF